MNQKRGNVSTPFSFLPSYLVEGGGRRKQEQGRKQKPLAILIFSVHIRFDILDQEMKTLMTQIDGVNLAANSLVESNHPRSAEVKKCQDHLNTRWDVERARRWGLLFWHICGVWPRSQEACYACQVCTLSVPASIWHGLLLTLEL